MKTHKFCQSCGMPRKKDPQEGGTEKDGSKSLSYCSFCYKEGLFCHTDTIDSPKKMQDMCIKMMKKQGMNGVLAWIFTRRIPKLERWKQ
ncbi:MAG: zinc ribbon domain-containing protein [Flavobacteriaceae bacterium]|nr:zinc ribbon domain-containing protein [Flavobacteriaceae bacterium]